MVEDKFISSPGEFEKFMEGSIFADFLNELDLRIEMLTNQLDDPELQYTGRDYDIFRGGIKNMRQMKGIFTDMAYAKDADNRIVGEKNED